MTCDVLQSKMNISISSSSSGSGIFTDVIDSFLRLTSTTARTDLPVMQLSLDLRLTGSLILTLGSIVYVRYCTTSLRLGYT